MQQDVIDRIFDPFFTTKERGQGTGLGLSIVYGVVEAAGGFIEVDSGHGIGTAIHVHLPVCQGTAPDAVHKALVQSRTGGETILVAEDEEGVRGIVDRILSRAGYEVLTVADGAAAVELAAERTGPIHLLITDVVMPGVSGKQLVEHMAGVRPGIEVLYMSGYTDQIIAAHGRLEEGEAFLQKPFSAEQLLEKVAELLAGGPDGADSEGVLARFERAAS
jgi:CheY-like chemotaxis protein